MADFGGGMFGSPIGQIAYDENRRQSIETAVKSQEAVGRIAMQPAMQRKLEAEAGGLEEELARRQAMTKIMQGGTEGGPAAPGGASADPVDFFRKKGMEAAGAGFTEEAKKLLELSSNLERRTAQTAASNATARVQQLKEIGDRADLMGQVFGGAKSEQDWMRANAVYEFQTGQASPYRSVPYSPELVSTLNSQALNVRERVTAEGARITREETARHNRSTEANSEANRKLREEEIRIQKEREDRLAKAGGGKAAAGSPSQEESRQVRNLMKLDGIDTSGMGAESVNSVAFSIASRAREMQQTNRALGRAQAIQQAFNEAKANGELEVETAGGVQAFDTRFGGEKRFAPKLDLPSAARSALKEGVEVTFGNGQVWTLQGGKPKRVR